ncbi:MAG: sugar phosphate nucleotidyltransferase [Candidatus Krumholzibacteria bacterium]|nr:sugar phosphate nucleotidyltransferase [Candidatus Krumholzibacteria bacterium]
MKVIVPAGGIGTRLRPQTHTRPKALIHVAGRPIISYILDEVRGLDVSGVVLIVGYKGELLKRYVAEEYPDLKIDYVVQEERNGIGHAIHLTRQVADTEEPVLIILGDTIVRTNLRKITKSKVNTLGVKEVEDPSRFGVAEVEDGYIVRLVEKPKVPCSNLAIVGLYFLRDSRLLFDILRQQIDRELKNHGEYQITDALQMMIDTGAKFTPFEIDTWFDCGKPETLLETNRQLLEGKRALPTLEGSIVVGPVSIAPSAHIVSSIIGPYVSIAADCSVTNSIIRDSVLDQGAKVSDCLLEGSIVGARALVKGGFKKLNIGDSSEVVFK